MAQPTYSWWPWRTLAVLIPVITYGGGIVAGGATRRAPSGFAHDELVILVTLTLFGAGNALLVGSAIGDLGRTLLAVLVTSAVSLLAVKWMGFSAAGFGPFMVVAAWAGCLALDLSVRSILEAVFLALWAFLEGLAVFLLAYVFSQILVQVLYLLTNSKLVGEIGTFLTPGLAGMAANLFFMGRIFRAAFRVTSKTALPEREIQKETAQQEADNRGSDGVN